MRSTLKLLASAGTASARHAERYLTPGNPTGLTGLLTHPCPRSALIYHYSKTLNQLAKLPASSAYREATAALTKHRLAIVQGVEPAGYGPWKEQAQATMAANRDAFGPAIFEYGEVAPEAFEARRFQREGFVRDRGPEDRALEWDGIDPEDALEGIRTQQERDQVARRDQRRAQTQSFEGRGVHWESSPPLDASQVQEIEDKIGAGLIEEVIQVAEGEAHLVDTMAESKVWEELTDKAPTGQWEYFARQQHMNPNAGQDPPKP